MENPIKELVVHKHNYSTRKIIILGILINHCERAEIVEI